MANIQDMISVVVPVYNVEQYLERCIQSVLRQTYRNLELVLIDDGSPDNSGMICDKYALDDCRVMVVHKENGGVSDARNEGLKLSKEWILFLDADDFLVDDYALEQLMYRVKNNIECDVVMFQTMTSKGGELKLRLPVIDQCELLSVKVAVESKKVRGEVWSYLFRADRVNKHAISFPSKVRISEDQAFVYSYMSYCQNILFVPINVIAYFQDNEQSSHALNNANQDAYHHIDAMNYLQQHVNHSMYRIGMGERMAMMHLYLLYLLTEISSSTTRNEVVKYFNENIKFRTFYIWNNKGLLVITSHINIRMALWVKKRLDKIRGLK